MGRAKRRIEVNKMYTMCRSCAVVLCLVCVGFYPLQAEDAADATVGIEKALPGQVAKLMTWKIVRADESRDAINAHRGSIGWITKIIDSRWLPEEPEKTLNERLILLEKAYEGLDTSHVEWERDGYRFRVSQTRTAFYLEVTPLEGKISDGDLNTQLKACRELAEKLIKDGEAMSIDGKTNLAPDGVKAILLHSSFDAAVIKQLDDHIVASPAIPDLSNKLERAQFECWWRRMGWWTNGETLGLFTVKSEGGGAWRADFDAAMGANWFSPPPPRVKSE